MWLRHIKWVILISVFLVGGVVSVAKGENNFFDQQKLTSHLIIDLFLLNVDQGKLEVFGQIIKRSQLQSQQVAYIHNLEDDSLSITIYLSLKESILIPHFEEFQVDVISIDIDKDGNILQVKSHVVPQNQ